jgi:2-dehydro-3-deoxyphosphogluconate aldolase/(4S)-4-hydroxy-2-oxoglutarate aldolase
MPGPNDQETELTFATVLRAAVVMPVLVIQRTEHAVSLARALAQGGLTVLEVTLRTACALDAIAAIRAALPQVQVGAGTVLNATDFRSAQRAGASFMVSPGFSTDVAHAAQESTLPWLPGVMTASDIMGALHAGYTQLKFFPAREAGGPASLRAYAGPFPEARFCPTGGITLENAPDYLALDNVTCVGGSWVAPAEMVEARDWDGIAALAAQAAALRPG